MAAIKSIYKAPRDFENAPEQILIKKARLFDPSQKMDGEYDVIVSKGKIEKIEKEYSGSFAGEVIEASGFMAMPGWFDMHVHLREPGREDEETVRSGSMAAANGGFTGIACMPNTDPALDSQEIVRYISDQARDSAVDVYSVAAITKGRKGEILAPIAELVEAGAVAISDDGSPVMNAELMRRALEYSKMFGIPVLGHEEDANLAHGRHMHEGYYSTKLGMPGIPALAEEIMVARDIMLTEYTGGKFHVCHISTRGAVDLVRQAKARGVNVTCEVTPHHFTLTDKEVESFDTNTKMNPPLRSEDDRLAMIEGLKDGTIDVIATDHAPHSDEEKEAEYIYAPFGITGLETAMGLIIKELLNTKMLDWQAVYEKCVVNPRTILNLPVPQISLGSNANFTLFNPGANWKISDRKSYSRSRNTPFADTMLTGQPVLVINNGRIFRPGK
jgi:dihydroorotase